MPSVSTVSLKLDAKLQAALNAYKAEYQIQSDERAIAAILYKFFNLTEATAEARLVHLEDQMDALIGKVGDIQRAIAGVQVEQFRAQQQATPSPAAVLPTGEGSEASEDDEDEMYDEPDEILQDFLPRE